MTAGNKQRYTHESLVQVVFNLRDCSELDFRMGAYFITVAIFQARVPILLFDRLGGNAHLFVNFRFSARFSRALFLLSLFFLPPIASLRLEFRYHSGGNPSWDMFLVGGDVKFLGLR